MYVCVTLIDRSGNLVIHYPSTQRSPPMQTHHSVYVCVRVYTCARECVSADSVSREVYYSLRSSASSGVMGQTARLH